MRLLFLIAGFFFAGLGFVGIFLPLLPTTIFLILSLFCFGKSSPHWENRLLANPHFGETLKNWKENKSISRKHKRLAMSILWLSLGTSLILASEVWMRIILLLSGISLTLYLFSLSTYPEKREHSVLKTNIAKRFEYEK